MGNLASIIIPVHNQLEYFKQCINSIQFATEKFELIIIDNGSTGDMIRYTENLRPHILIRNSQNQGVAKAWNQGISLATTDKYLILNSDIVVEKGWFEHLVSALNREDILCVQPEFQKGEEVKDFSKRAAEQLTRNKEPIHINSFCGFCFGIKKETIDKLGYFDEAFKVWVDKDYYHRIKKGELKMWSLPNILIHHFESRTLRSMENNGFEYKKQDEQAWDAKWK